ncbi:MAG: FimB/Mfa2 family fimbrial subunit [Bacteroidales bacterium]
MMEIITIYKDKITVCKTKPVIRKIKLLSTILLTTFVVVTLTGCVKDELNNTPHSNKGAVRVTTHWTELSKDAVQPKSYLLRIGEFTHTVSGKENIFKDMLPQGSYTLLVHNTPAGVTINAAKAEVNTLPNGTLEPLPNYLFSAAKEFEAIKDDTLNVSVKMVQSLRILQLTLKLSAADAERITSTAATLTGISHSINLTTGQADIAGIGKTVVPNFQVGSINRAGSHAQPTLVAHLRLAGMASGSRQVLTLLFTLIGDTVVSIETDLTQALKDFGKEINPLALDATIKLPNYTTDMGATGTITNWEVVDNGNITIH